LPRILGANVWINLGGLEWKRTKWHPLVRRYVKMCEWFCGKAASRVICDAKAIQDYFQREYGSAAATSFVAYGAPKLPLTSESANLLPDGIKPHQYLLLVSRLEPENNVLEVIQGFLQHPQNEMPLVVVGNVDARPYVQALRHAADTRVVFLGGVYDKARLAALRRYAFASFHGHSVGGTNPSLLEALAAGRPIIAHDNAFNREVGGALLKYFGCPSDIPPILSGLEQEARAQDLDQLSAASRWLDERYTWDGVAREYAQLARAEGSRARP
jgi:glycosyltransferase involved in cell wall biosynthesis